MHKIFAALLVVSVLALPVYAQDAAPVAGVDVVTEWLPVAAVLVLGLALLIVGLIAWRLAKSLGVSMPAETLETALNAALVMIKSGIEAGERKAQTTKTPVDDMIVSGVKYLADDVLLAELKRRGLVSGESGTATAQSAGE